VLLDRDGRLAAVLDASAPRHPTPTPQWVEDRFWPWVHYLAGKLARGELFEVIDGLGFLRARVFGPLVLARVGAQPAGVRRFEASAPDWVDPLRATVPQHDAADCARAVRAAIALYRELRRSASPAVEQRGDAERAAMAFLDQVTGS